MGADDSAQTPEKPSKSSATTSAAATPTKHSSSSSGHPEASNSSAARKKPDSHLLLRHQGQKWQNVFDFEKILRQLRVAERQLKHKKCEYFGTNNVCQGCNADPGPNALQADSPPRAVKQVQRLDSRDMHYYGIVGNRSMLDIIVCNVCGGSYTKMGFNNHMMLHHPSVWSTISTKVELPQGGCEASVRLLPSGTDAATASEAAAPSSASESTTSRHKSKKASSKSGGGSSSSTSRSRSKSKHHSSSSHSSKHSSSVVVETKPPAAELPSSSSTSSSSSKKSGKNSKKGTSSSSSSSAAAAAAAANAAASSSKDSKAGGYSVIEPSLSSLSSTSSSSSTTTTPKKSATPTLDSLVGASLANDAKDKVLTEKMSPIPSKKKSKSSSHSAPQESLDLAAPSSAPVFERPVSTAPAKSQKSSSNSSASKSSSSAASSSSYSTAKSSSSKKSKSEQKRSSSSAAAAAVADVAHQLSELDRAVSSITGGQEVKREPAATQADDVKPTSAKSGKSVAVGAYRKPPLLAELKKEIKTEPSASKYDAVNAAAAGGMTQDTGSPLNNTILTFDDMLDNKFINEILGNSETELSYDSNCGNDSNGGMQQPAYSQHKPPASKRMRFDVQDSSQSMELQNDFAIYQPQQQQQQQTQQQQQFANYNGPAGVLEDIKLYNSPQSSNQTMEYQPQMHVPTQILQHQDQMDTVEANQLQQILYQQQQQQGMFHENGAKVELLQAPQFQQSQYCPEAGDVKPKSMEMCAASEQDVKLEQYATLTAINTAYGDGGVGVAQPMVESEFQLYNVPSITDEASAMAMPAAGQQQDIIVNNMRLRCDPQYVLPPGNNGDGDEGQQHLIYEITGNNQVSVLRQHQVIAELLNQAGYENVEYMNVATPTGTTATTPAAAAAAGASGADESSEWFDFDFSHIETAKTVLGSSSGSSSSSQIKPAKSEFSNLTPLKFHDDFYANVHVYARIPRPLALNTFGLVKLPWSVASTFRKQIVSARKANHSPVSLNMAGGGPNALAARGAKAAHNYFTALSAATPGSSPVANNEFSIGSITITNSQNPAQAGGPGGAAAGLRPPGQQNGHIEISLNAAAAANNPAAAAHSKLRQRMAGMMASPSGPIGSSLNPGSVTTSIGAVHCGSPSSNVRTVYVQNSPNALRIREPVVKRCVIASQTAAAAPNTAATGVVAGQDSSKPARKLTAKQISEFLTSGRRIFEQQAPPTPTPPMPPPAVESCPKKMVRMNNFY